MILQSAQRDVIAAISALLPRVHVVVENEPRKGAMEASASFVHCSAVARLLLKLTIVIVLQVDLFVPTPSGNKRFNLHSKIRTGQVT